MSYASDDLAPLLASQPATGAGYRQGVVLAWDPTTAANTIDVGGALINNVPVLNTSESLLLQPGDVVGLLTAGASWCVLGRLTYRMTTLFGAAGWPLPSTALSQMHTFCGPPSSTSQCGIRDSAGVGFAGGCA